jgi:hypothetical protein
MYSECVSVVLVTQHAKRMCRSILSSVACLAITCFSTLSNKQHDLKKNVGNKMCFDVFSEGSYWMTLRKAEDTHI